MGKTPNLEKLLGLHQGIDIIYTPVQYVAYFTNESSVPATLFEATGETIGEALDKLEVEAANWKKTDKYRIARVTNG